MLEEHLFTNREIKIPAIDIELFVIKAVGKRLKWICRHCAFLLFKSFTFYSAWKDSELTMDALISILSSLTAFQLRSTISRSNWSDSSPKLKFSCILGNLHIMYSVVQDEAMERETCVPKWNRYQTHKVVCRFTKKKFLSNNRKIKIR